MLNRKVEKLSFVTSFPKGAQIYSVSRSSLANLIAIGGVLLAYYVLADLIPDIRGDKIMWESAGVITPGRIWFLRRTPEDFENFLEYVRVETKADVFGVLRSPDNISVAVKPTDC